MADLAENLKRVRERMEKSARKAGREPGDVQLVAVTKTVSPERLREAVSLGLAVFGENKVQEALPKIEALKDVEWHFIGHLQTNKAGKAAGNFRLIHSVDSIGLAEVLDRKAGELDKTLDILCEVKLSPEATKFGLEPAEFEKFLEALIGLKRLRCRGVMAMAPLTKDKDTARRVFRQARALWERHVIGFCGQPVLSMGMSDDFEAAIEEGATLVRIGRAIFGPQEKNT
jgi:pyridoxal phosphate enzyme (YggS family)